MSPSPHEIVHRRFLQVGERQVHYRRVGKGPPALFIHSSPTNSSFVLADMLAQCDRYTCFAFDTPGFGLSDPLSLAQMKVADLANAIAEAMTALGLPPVPVFGTHSGAAIALELGYRHPEKVTGLVLDGVPIFTRAEVEPLRGAYFAPLTTDVLGSQYASTWTRFRDQSIWFPWCSRVPENLNEYDLATPENTHRWLGMFFAAADHYKPAYLAVTSYCEDAVEAAAGLTVPAVFTATETDMLHPHLDRLPPLREGQRIAAIGTSQERKRDLTGESFALFGSDGTAPASQVVARASARILRQFTTDGTRAQMARHAGDPANEAVLLLHDAPGSSLMLEDRIAALAADRFVIAPDIPGSGESEGLDAAAELADYADALWRLCDAFAAERVVLEGRGLGAALAAEMALRQPTRVVSVRLDGPLLPTAAEREDMIARFVPAIPIEYDGAHWYRLWLRLRDSLVYWPWYDTRRAALRRVPAPIEARALHDWTVEVMKQRETYAHFPLAVLRHDLAAALRACTVPLALLGHSDLGQSDAVGAEAFAETLDTLLGSIADNRQEARA